jgi:ribosomal protein L24
MHVRRGDTVAVIAGKEKGKRGKVLRILNKKDRVVVERIMMVKRHTKPSQKQPQGGIIEKEGSLHVSNVSSGARSAPRRARRAYRSTKPAGSCACASAAAMSSRSRRCRTTDHGRR